jgi:hypothetical protein
MDKEKKILIKFSIFASLVISIILFFSGLWNDKNLVEQLFICLFSGTTIVITIVGPFWRLYLNTQIDSTLSAMATLIPFSALLIFLTEYSTRLVNSYVYKIVLICFILIILIIASYKYYIWLRNKKE